MYVAACVRALPIISKPLENTPDHLVWEALLTVDTHRSDDKTRKIPKSIFITPNLNESNCPPDHKLGPDGRCYKTLKIDPLVILKTQIESLLNKKNRTATTEYDEDYDYSEYGESTESIQSNGQYTVPLSLGFGSDNRIPQQQQQQQHTTFPNLNRVVKDGFHVSSPAVSNSNNDKENQPFLVSTTGLDLGSEDIFVESEREPGVSVAPTSSILPPTTKNAITLETSSSTVQTQSTTAPSIISTVAPIIASTTASTITESENIDESKISSSTDGSIQNLSSISTEYIVSSSIENVVTLSPHSSPIVVNLSANAKRILSTEKIEHATQPFEGTSPSDKSDKITDATDAIPKQTADTIFKQSVVEAPEIPSMPISTEASEASTNSQTTETTEQMPKSDVTSTETSVNTAQTIALSSPEQVETHQSESSDSKPLALSQTNIEQILMDLTEKQPPPPTTTTIITTDSLTETEKKESLSFGDEEKHAEKVSIVHPSVKIMSMNLQGKPSVEPTEKVIIVQALSSTEPSTVTANTDALSSSKSDSYEVIDAYFIPSQSETPEEIDPANGKISNTTAAQRYRLENASDVDTDDELAEAEIAPIIDTGSDGLTNIELIDESSQASKNEDEQTNLNTRLAEELLFQGARSDPADGENTSSRKTKQTFESATESDSREKKIDIEEGLSGAALGGSFNFGAEFTTEGSIDYGLKEKEIKAKTENINVAENMEFKKNVEYEGELPEREALPFREQELFRPALPAPSAPVQPSIYSTFINRLKSAPPFVELAHDHQPESIEYSHTPFHIVTSNRRINEQITTHPTFTLPDANQNQNFETSAIVEQPPHHGKSLPVDRLNCYLKQLANRQQLIFCDDA